MGLLPPDQTAIVQRTRDILTAGRKTSITDIQRLAGTEDPNIKLPSCVSRVVFPAPRSKDDTVLQLVCRAIEGVGRGNNHYTTPSIIDIDARWTGQLSAIPDSTTSSMSEREKYLEITKRTTNPLTILLIHGGGFYMGTPGRYHPLAVNLATLTGGRCLSFRYRLAPQNPFPAALLDCLVCYLSLLYPPPGSFHEPVPASSIVLTGDSAGACLALALTQLLIFAQSSTVHFHGRFVEVPFPSGLALLSAGLDFTLALPSWKRFASNDIFQDTWSMLEPTFSSCSIWPSDPPRGHPYCETSMMDHPLVAPAMASNWRGSPPMWLAGGQERFSDSAKVVAEQAARQGVLVRYEEYEEMPHDFPIMSLNWPWATTDQWPQSVKCLHNWANACKTFSQGEQLQDKGAVLYMTDGGERQLDVKELTGLTFEEVQRLIREKQAEWKPWTGNAASKSIL